MAARQLKRIEDQVIVVTGASSGIGLATARLAAARGARVVLVARNAGALEHAVEAIEAEGGAAAFVVGDVASPDDMERVAQEAIDAYGGIDTWVNNAASSIYGRLDEVPLADKRRLMDVVFWGVVHGTRAALPHLRREGGALVTVGSMTSDQAMPLIGMYSAAKHAVKGYVDALRIELEEEGAPVAVSLVKPSSIDTMFFEHARNYMDAAPKPLPPVYAPELVAETILHCATHGTREITVGGGGAAVAALGALAPSLADRYLERTGFTGQKADAPPRAPGGDNLYDFAEDGRVRGGYAGRVLERSAWTTIAQHPWTVLLAAAGVGAAIAIGGRTRRRDTDAYAADASLPLAVATPDEASREAYDPTAIEVAADAPAGRRPAMRADRAMDRAMDRPVELPVELEPPRASSADDVGGTSTEDSASGMLLDARLQDASTLDEVPLAAPDLDVPPPSPARGKTDEDWLQLG